MSQLEAASLSLLEVGPCAQRKGEGALSYLSPLLASREREREREREINRERERERARPSSVFSVSLSLSLYLCLSVSRSLSLYYMGTQLSLQGREGERGGHVFWI